METLPADQLVARLKEHLRDGQSADGASRFVERKRRIVGDLDLSGLALPFPVEFEDCELDRLILVDARLDILRITRSTLSGIEGDRLAARGLQFDDEFVCKGSMWLPEARVEGDMNCGGATVENPRGWAVCLDGAHIGGRLFLRHGTYRGRVSAINARLDGGVSAFETTFEARRALDLARARIGGRLFLSKATVHGELRLFGVSVAEDVVLLAESLAGKVNLRAAVIDGQLRWRPTLVDGLTHVVLERARVGRLDDRGANWPEHGVNLRGFVYDDIADLGSSSTWTADRIEWIRRANGKRFDRQPYEQLEAVMRRGGYVHEARQVAMAKHDDLRGSGHLSRTGKWFNRFLGLTLGHGYAVWRALIPALVLAVIGALVFWYGEDAGQLAKGRANAPSFAAAIYSLDMLLPIVDLGQADARPPVSGISLYYSWLQISAGWLLATLIGLGLSGVVKKD